MAPRQRAVRAGGAPYLARGGAHGAAARTAPGRVPARIRVGAAAGADRVACGAPRSHRRARLDAAARVACRELDGPATRAKPGGLAQRAGRTVRGGAGAAPDALSFAVAATTGPAPSPADRPNKSP